MWRVEEVRARLCCAHPAGTIVSPQISHIVVLASSLASQLGQLVLAVRRTAAPSFAADTGLLIGDENALDGREVCSAVVAALL